MARQFTRILGAIFLILGILGYIPALTPNGLLFGIFMVDGVHNFVHLLSGIILLAVGAGASEYIARNTALGFGIVYGLITLIGFVGGGSILGLFMVNMADNLLHLVISFASLAVGLSKERRIPVR